MAARPFSLEVEQAERTSVPVSRWRRTGAATSVVVGMALSLVLLARDSGGSAAARRRHPAPHEALRDLSWQRDLGTGSVSDTGASELDGGALGAASSSERPEMSEQAEATSEGTELSDPSISFPRTVIFIGGTGAGKSTLGNFLSGKPGIFKMGGSINSTTTDVSAVDVDFFGDKSKGTAKLVDTPGLADTLGRDKEQWDHVVDTLKCDIQRAHAIVLVIRGNSKDTKELRQVVQQLRSVFGPSLWKMLKLVLNWVDFDIEQENQQAKERRDMLIRADMVVSGEEELDDATRKTIEAVPVFAVNLAPLLLSETEREDELEELEIESMEHLTLSECIEADAKIEEKLLEKQCSSFKECKDKLGRKEFKKELGKELWAWARSKLGSYHYGRLEQLRRSIMKTVNPFELRLEELAGSEVEVVVVAETTAFDLGKTRITLSVEATRQELLNTLHDMPIARDLIQKGWATMQDTTLYDGDFVIGSDEQLQALAAELVSQSGVGGAGGSASTIRVRLRWRSGSPPSQLDRSLVELCKKDLDAMESLVEDGVTTADQLIFIKSVAGLHRTSGHGLVMDGLKKLKEEQVEAYRKSPSYKETTEKANADLKDGIDKAVKVQRHLQPIADEAKKLVEDASKRREKIDAHLQEQLFNLLSELKSRDMLGDVQDQLAEQARNFTNGELLEFLGNLDKHLTDVRKDMSSKEVLGAEKLIINSGVLQGVYLSTAPSLKKDVLRLKSAPDVRHLLRAVDVTKMNEHIISKSIFQGNVAEQALNTVGTTSALAISGTAAGMAPTAGIAGALSFAADVGYKKNERSDWLFTNHKSVSQYSDINLMHLPMQTLMLPGSAIRFLPSLNRHIAHVLKLDRAKWPDAVMRFFAEWGTHYCPVVSMGGTWWQRAIFKSESFVEEEIVKKALSECLNSKAEVGAVALLPVGFGKIGGSAKRDMCEASDDSKNQKTTQVLSNTKFSQKCNANFDCIDSSKMAFRMAMQVNSNWMPIDRKLDQCVPLWQAVRDPHDQDVFQFLPPGWLEANASALLSDFINIVEKVYHFKVLDLLKHCKELGKLKQVKEFDERCSEAISAASAGRLMDLNMTFVYDLWYMFSRADQAGLALDMEKKRQQCKELDQCNEDREREPHGECVWNTNTESAECQCNAHFYGSKCQFRRADKSCVGSTRVSECSWGWSNQPGCKKEFGPHWEFVDWGSCASRIWFGEYYRCQKRWRCTPKYSDDHNCCRETEPQS